METFKNDGITWAAFSPLIGGNPIGFEYASGKPPEYAMNMNGYWGNDSLYINYMKQRGIEVPYYNIETENTLENFKQVDVVVATCICAGLSQLNTGKSKETKGADAKQNDHMYNSTRFVLEHIRPKVLTGENAPALFSPKGKVVADRLKSIAEEYGYTYSMYKTNTALHGIPQNRHRTFYFMWKSDTVPELEWYDMPSDTLVDFLKKVPVGLHSDIIINPKIMNEPHYRFIQQKTGKTDVRADILSKGKTAHQWVINSDLLDEYIEWAKNDTITPRAHYLGEHAKMKYAKGMGIWDGSVHVHLDRIAAYIGRNAVDTIHPTEDRSLNLREGMALMGMPLDFELVGGMSNHPKLPQNVPTCTAKSMGEQVVKFLNGELKMTNYKSLKQDNERRIVMDYDTDKILQKAKPVVELDIQTLEEHFN